MQSLLGLYVIFCAELVWGYKLCVFWGDATLLKELSDDCNSFNDFMLLKLSQQKA